MCLFLWGLVVWGAANLTNRYCNKLHRSLQGATDLWAQAKLQTKKGIQGVRDDDIQHNYIHKIPNVI